MNALILKYHLNSPNLDNQKLNLIDKLLEDFVLHLNFNGCDLGSFLFPINFVLQDAYLGNIDFSRIVINITLNNVCFTGSKLLGGDFVNAKLDAKAQKDIEDYYDTDLAAVTSRSNHFAASLDSYASTLEHR